MLYCNHQIDYENLIRNFQEDLFVEKDTADKIELKFGVYVNANQESDMEERFVCALHAAESATDDPDRVCGYYNSDYSA